MRKESVGYLLVIASGVIYGLMPLMSRLVSADGVSSLSITAFRAWAAMAVLSPAWLSPGRGRVKITLRQLPWVVCAAVLGYILTPLLLIDSYAYIDTGMATTLHYVYPALVLTGCAVFFRQRVSAKQWLCIALCLFGTAMFYAPSGAGFSVRGMLIAIGSGVAYAAYILLLSAKPLREMSLLSQLIGFSFAAGLIFAVLALVSGDFTVPTNPKTWALFLLLIFTTGVAANALFQAGVKLVDSKKASILGTTEPLTSILVGAAVFNEALTLRSILGCLSILAGVTLLTLTREKEKPDAAA